MSALKEYRKQIGAGAVVAVFGIAILAAMASYYFPAQATTDNASGCQSSGPIPSNVYKDAPVQGYTYLVAYNTTNGKILDVQVEPSCELNGVLPTPPTTAEIIGSPPHQVQVATSEAYLNATADPNLRPLMANGYINVFYVDTSTNHLDVVPGVTFNSDDSQAYYNGQPITNGTSFQIPGQ